MAIQGFGYWLDEEVKYISKPIEGEGRNLIKKGWDQLYMDPINKEGFLEQVKEVQKVSAEKREKDKVFRQTSLFVSGYERLGSPARQDL